MTPDSIVGLGFKFILGRMETLLRLKSKKYIQQGTPLGGGTPKSQFVDLYGQVRDEDTGNVVTESQGTSIDDVMGGRDWAIVLDEIFENPAQNKSFIDAISDFLVKSGVAKGRETIPKAQKGILRYFENLSMGMPESKARNEAAKSSDITKKTMRKYVRQILANLAKAFDSNIKIPFDGKIQPAESTPETRGIANALMDTIWMRKFQRKMEKGKGLEDYIPQGARKPMRVRSPSKFEIPKGMDRDWEDSGFSKKRKRKFQKNIEEVDARRQEILDRPEKWREEGEERQRQRNLALRQKIDMEQREEAKRSRRKRAMSLRVASRHLNVRYSSTGLSGPYIQLREKLSTAPNLDVFWHYHRAMFINSRRRLISQKEFESLDKIQKARRAWLEAKER